MRHNYDFKYLTKNVGKGNKNRLRRLQVEAEGNESMIVNSNKDKIEQRFLSLIKIIFSNVLQSKSHKEKTHVNLNNDTRINNILDGELD